MLVFRIVSLANPSRAVPTAKRFDMYNPVA
uniref:Uncharacterized protein n=1 Tax=Anguilla anguilla TaxID=7936 RepID=A0A0E9T4F2_ANGAN